MYSSITRNVYSRSSKRKYIYSKPAKTNIRRVLNSYKPEQNSVSNHGVIKKIILGICGIFTTDTLLNNLSDACKKIRSLAFPIEEDVKLSEEGTINLAYNAGIENPAVIASELIKEKWSETDLQTGIKSESLDLFNLPKWTEINNTVGHEHNEVTPLILKNELEKMLATRYENFGNEFAQLAQKYSAEIEDLAKKYPDDIENFAISFFNILAKDFDLAELAPFIYSRKSDDINGYFDVIEGSITVADELVTSEVVETISHEFIHILQYVKILVERGRQGIVDIINYDKELTPPQKKVMINRVLSNKFTKEILSVFRQIPLSKGTLEDYITQIYIDEMSNPAEYTYYDQLTEREAFYFGSNKITNGVSLEKLGAK